MSTNQEPPTTETPVRPAHPDRNIEIQLRYQFTDKELLELGKKMAEAANLLNQQEEEAKAVAKQLKAKCDQTAARLTEASTKITNGYEYRSVKCVVKFDTPKTGQKSTIRQDTLEIVDVCEMSLAEMQLPLPLKTTDGKLAPVEPFPDAPKSTPGTVEVPADEGSRDDAGPEAKDT